MALPLQDGLRQTDPGGMISETSLNDSMMKCWPVR